MTINKPSLFISQIESLKDIITKIIQHKSARYGFGIILCLIVVAIFADFISPYDPNTIVLSNNLQPMNKAHWFGTDELGRDILSRIIHGSRCAFYVVVLVSLFSAPLGLFIGVTAGYCQGIIDTILMRITDVVLAFPKLILALTFVAALGPGLENAILAISITAWAPYARLARSKTLSYLESDFMYALKIQGASHTRLIFRHLMPLCCSSILIALSLDMCGFILAVAGLGFLGLGAKPPLPEWGSMLATGHNYMLDQWWLVTFPGIAILIMSLGFNLLGDGLCDIFDPKQRKVNT